MKKIPRMSRAQRRRLMRLGRRSGDPLTALRFLAIAHLAAGRRSPQVAHELDVARSTVIRAAHRFADEGVAGLYDKRVGNGATKVDEAFRDRVAELLRHTPHHFGWSRPTWTRELLCHEMIRQGFAEVACCTMGRALHDIGARLGMARPIVLCPWKRAEKERVLQTLRAIASHSCDDEPVLYGDEVDIHLNPRIGRDWMLRGHQRRIVTPGKNAKHYVAGALAAHDDAMTWVEGPSKSSALFVKLLFRVLGRYRGARRIHLIVDNYVIHRSLITERALESIGDRLVVHFLPPYCPDHNRIERKWQDLHANVTRNHRCKNIGALMTNVREYLKTRSRGRRVSVRELRSVI